MSLARLALRLAAYEALCPAATPEAGPFPTLAGPLVYDSRVDRIETLSETEQGSPIIVVYTEGADSKPYSEGGLGSKEHFADLVIEAALAVATDIKTGEYRILATDRVTEGIMDVHEALIRRVFDRKAAVGSADLFRRVSATETEIESVPLRDSDGTARFAQRTIRYRCKIKADAWPQPAFAAVPPEGLERLPEPLRSVAAALPPGSSGRDLCEGLVGLMPAADGLVPLAGIDLYLGINRQPTAADFDIRARAINP